MSNSLLPHGLQHARLPCPSPTSGVYSTHEPLPTLFLDNISSAINGNIGLGRFQASVKAERKPGKARNWGWIGRDSLLGHHISCGPEDVEVGVGGRWIQWAHLQGHGRASLQRTVGLGAQKLDTPTQTPQFSNISWETRKCPRLSSRRGVAVQCIVISDGKKHICVPGPTAGGRATF